MRVLLLIVLIETQRSVFNSTLLNHVEYLRFCMWNFLPSILDLVKCALMVRNIGFTIIKFKENSMVKSWKWLFWWS